MLCAFVPGYPPLRLRLHCGTSSAARPQACQPRCSPDSQCPPLTSFLWRRPVLGLLSMGTPSECWQERTCSSQVGAHKHRLVMPCCVRAGEAISLGDLTITPYNGTSYSHAICMHAHLHAITRAHKHKHAQLHTRDYMNSHILICSPRHTHACVHTVLRACL